MKPHYVLLLGMLIMTPFVSAQQVSTQNAPSGIEIAIERIQLAFTFNEDRRAQLHLEFAQERLEELQTTESPTQAQINRAIADITRHNGALTVLIPQVESDTLDAIERGIITRTHVLEELRERLPTVNGLTIALEAPQHREQIQEHQREAHAHLEEIKEFFPIAQRAVATTPEIQDILAPYERIDILIPGTEGITLLLEEGLLTQLSEQMAGTADITITLESDDVTAIRRAIRNGDAMGAVKALAQADVSPVQEQIKIAGLVIADRTRNR